MRLTGWHIDACGHLNDVGTRGLGPTITVLVGPNEAGKTTTHYFLRGVLFGFPSGNAKDARRYKPADATIGGRIWLEHAGRSLQLERFGTATPTLVDTNGSPIELGLDTVLGNATRQLFEAVFAVNLDDLAELGELNGDSVRERIFAASVSGGGRPARDAIADLEKQREKILRTRKGRLRELRDELQEAQAALASAQQESQRLPAVEADLAAAREAVTDRSAELDQLRSRADHLKRLTSYWQDWYQLNAWRFEWAELPDLDLGPDPVGRMEAELASLGACEEVLAELEHRIRSLQTDIAETQVDERLLGLADRIHRADRQLTEASTRSAHVAERSSHLAENRSILEQRCAQHLGTGWKPHHLEDIDISHPAQERLTRAASSLAAAERGSQESRSRVEQLTTERSELERRLETGPEDPLGKLGLPSNTSLRGALADVQVLQRKLPELVAERRSRDLRASPRRAVPGWLSPAFGVIAVLAALATALGGATGQFALAATTGVITILAFLACVAAAVQAGRHEPEGVGSRERVALLQTQVSTAAERLGLPPEPDDDTVARLAGELPAAITRQEGVQRDRDRHSELIRTIQNEQEQLDQAIADEARATEAWRQNVRQCGLPAELAPDTVSRLVQAVTELRRDAERLAGEEAQLEREHAELREMALEQEQLLTDAAVLGPTGAEVELQLEPSGRAQAVRDLKARLAEATEAAEQRQRWREQLTEAEQALPARREAADLEHRRVEQRLAAGGAPDPDSYRELAARVERRAELATLIEQAEIALQAAFGTGDSLQRARDDLAAADPHAWETELRSVDSRIAELSQSYQEAVRSEQAVSQQLEDLERSARVAERSAALEALRAEAADLTREWTTLTMARDAIDSTLEMFERERQPGVVKDAAASYSRVTGQRWESLFPGAEGELAVAGASGRRLDASRLSRGATEQLYLSMRLALARAHAENAEPLPLLLDDVLVNADDSRRERLAAELGRAADHLQVVMFTASENTAELLARTRPDTTVIDLHAGQGIQRG